MYLEVTNKLPLPVDFVNIVIRTNSNVAYFLKEPIRDGSNFNPFSRFLTYNRLHEVNSSSDAIQLVNWLI